MTGTPLETGGDESQSTSMNAQRFEVFYESMQNLRFYGVDPYENAHNSCLADLLELNQDIRRIFGNFLSNHASVTPTNTALRTVKSSQALEMQIDPTFPLGRDDPDSWLPTFARLIEDPSYQDQYLTNLLLPVASNVSERGKLLKVALVLNDKVDTPKILDVGCSLNHNLKRFALFADPSLRYDPTQVLAEKPRNGTKLSDKLSSLVFDRLVNDVPIVLGDSLGVDIWGADSDIAFRNWARSNSFYMSELLDKHKTEQFDRLAAAQPPEVSFKAEDATKYDPALEGHFDVAYLSTMLYQLGPKERDAVLSNSIRTVKDDGLVVIQDYVDVKPDGTQRYFDKWNWRWNYGMWVFDKSKPNEGFQKYFSVESGRVRRVVVEPALGQLATAHGVRLLPSV